MTLRDDPAFGRVTRHLEQLGAGAIALYRDPCLERRLASRLRASGRSLADYAGLLDTDHEERRRLLSALAIGVTSFFRNPTVWRRLLELLRAAPARGPVAAWSAGCATGEEAYSVAMLLAWVAGAPGSLPGEWRIDATDLDERSLAVAREGRYPARVLPEIEAVGPPLGARAADRFEVAPFLRARVQFLQDDVTAPGQRGPYDLVVCRNVLIYFGAEGQQRALASLTRSLAPGGLLLLGRTELAARDVGPLLELVDGRARIYRRVA